MQAWLKIAPAAWLPGPNFKGFSTLMPVSRRHYVFTQLQDFPWNMEFQHVA